MTSQDIFYEPGKTDHGLPRDPYKVGYVLTPRVHRKSPTC